MEQDKNNCLKKELILNLLKISLTLQFYLKITIAHLSQNEISNNFGE